jgi:hypothetical protein
MRWLVASALVALSAAALLVSARPAVRRPHHILTEGEAYDNSEDDPFRHPFISRERLMSVEREVRARVANMSNLQKAKALDMYSGNDFLTNGTVDWNKARALLADSVGIIHDLYAPTTDLVNALQQIAIEQSSTGIPVLFLEEVRRPKAIAPISFLRHRRPPPLPLPDRSVRVWYVSVPSVCTA